MKFIGESINTSIKRVREAVEQGDADYIKRLALAQQEAGASYIDVNCGTRIGDEVEKMDWLVKQVQEVCTLPLAIDSPSPAAIERGLSLTNNKKQPIINSITGEKERMAAILPLITRYKAKVIALLLDDQGMPSSAEDRVRIADNLIPALLDAGVPAEDIIVDPIVRPIGTGDTAGVEVFEAIGAIKERYPNVHFSIGLSNISHGIPVDEMTNHAFMIMCIMEGLDFGIVNILDEKIKGYALIAEALAGKDRFCAKLLKGYRKGYFPETQNYLDL
jgi:5-methyltetrahydrofolate--homocysteine methyltransferase